MEVDWAEPEVGKGRWLAPRWLPDLGLQNHLWLSGDDEPSRVRHRTPDASGAPCIATRSFSPAISTVGGIPLCGGIITERGKEKLRLMLNRLGPNHSDSKQSEMKKKPSIWGIVLCIGVNGRRPKTIPKITRQDPVVNIANDVSIWEAESHLLMERPGCNGLKRTFDLQKVAHFLTAWLRLSE